MIPHAGPEDETISVMPDEIVLLTDPAADVPARSAARGSVSSPDAPEPGSVSDAASDSASGSARGYRARVATGVDADVDEMIELTAAWFAAHRRDLPWRDPAAGPWAVMISEFMLQQTPVSRVLPVYEAWLDRWPRPAALAAEQPGEAVRAWGRLGYPRRALRLHAAAVAIVQEHGGVVPDDYHRLRALPGVGEYTAAAIVSFAFGRRAAVLDTNVRRVLVRAFEGIEFPADSVSAAERALAVAVLPAQARRAAAWAAASMELGALICTARTPKCSACPISGHCAWNRLGRPPRVGPARRVQAYAGTDRQARGALLAVLRESRAPVGPEALAEAWKPLAQRERALGGLVADGLAVELPDGRFQLP